MSRDNPIEELGDELMFQSLKHHVQSVNAHQSETGQTDSKGTMIKAGDVIQCWASHTGFSITKPEGVETCREVLVVQRKEDGHYACVDYDRMESCPLPMVAQFAIILGTVLNDEGLEHLRKGLVTFDGNIDEEEAP